jgi:hypothetical protein
MMKIAKRYTRTSGFFVSTINSNNNTGLIISSRATSGSAPQYRSTRPLQSHDSSNISILDIDRWNIRRLPSTSSIFNKIPLFSCYIAGLLVCIGEIFVISYRKLKMFSDRKMMSREKKEEMENVVATKNDKK